MSNIVKRVHSRKAALVGACTGAIMAMSAGVASAAASPTTGVDYLADLVTPVKSELTLAITAGLGILVVLIALRAGIKLVRSFGK